MAKEEIGVGLAQQVFGADAVAIRDYAQAADSLGFNFMFVGDHLLGEDPATYNGPPGNYTSEYLWHDTFVLFSHLAAITQKLEFINGVLVLPLKPTVHVAKQAAELDMLSGGRLRLGIGVGWNRLEYDAMHQEFENRGKRIEEQMALLRALWTQQHVNFEGKYDRVVNAGLNPMPVRQPIPIWIGGQTEPVMRRTAKLADGWIAAWPMDKPRVLDALTEPIKTIKAYARAEGRGDDFPVVAPVAFAGLNPDECRAQLAKARAMGINGPIVATGQSTSPADHIQVLRDVAEALKP